MKASRAAYFELIAVPITAGAKFVIFDMMQKQFWFIISASAFWAGYLIYNFFTSSERITQWGFRKKGFWESSRLLLPLAVIAIVLFITYGIDTGKAIVNWHIIPSLLTYPVWGIAQQFVIMALVAGNLNDLEKYKIPRFLIIIISALLFSGVHFPNYQLMAGTFILALVYTTVYLKYRNLWVLGILHGWLGSIFYFFVLGKDAWLRFLTSY